MEGDVKGGRFYASLLITKKTLELMERQCVSYGEPLIHRISHYNVRIHLIRLSLLDFSSILSY